MKGDTASAASSLEPTASSTKRLASNVEPTTALSGEPAPSSTELTATNFEKTCSSGITTVAIFIKVGFQLAIDY
jgi:hypothetical protein